MHVTVDLGFPSLVLAVCLVVVPVFGFVIRGKWQRAVARKEEIGRLLALASEEAARAELENTLSYYGSLDGAVPISVPSSLPYSSSSLRNGYQCAVCYCPTTMRCSRCKAVRYCSWKCQFIHWREGHKEECHPFSEDYHINANGRTSSQKVALQEQQEVSNGRLENASVDTTSVDLNLNNSNSSTGHVKDDDNKDDRFANEEGTFTASESSGGPFSGFSTSPFHSGSSDDVSFGENTGSNETEGSEGYMSTDAGLDVLEHNFNEVGHSQPSSPKFGSLVDSIDSCNKSSVSNHSQHPSVDGRESKHAVADSSWRSRGAMYKNSTTKHGDGCSGFWGKTLDSVMTSLENVDDSACANLVGDRNWNKSHAEPLLHANPKSQSDVPSMQVQGSASKGTTLVPAVASKAVDRTALSEKPAVSDIEVMSFPPVSFEKSNQVVDDASGASDLSRSSEHKAVPSSSSGAHLFSSKKGGFLPVDALEVNLSASLPSERASFSVNESVSVPHKAKIRIQSTAPQSHLVPEKHDSSESGLTTSPSTSISPSYVGGLKSSMLKAVDQLRGPKYERCNDKGLFSYKLFVKLYNSKKVEIKPFGLVNCGNSCYANAVLQCLAFTPPLTAYFAQGLHSKKCVSKGWCFTCEFERLILKAKEGKSPLSPIGILSQLQHIGSQLSNGREEDAHEFLRYSVDTMQSVYLKEAGANSLASLQEETTLVGLTFGGYLHSKIKCLKCQYKSEQQERMMDLAIEIGGDIVKLEDALRQFTSSEILDGDNKYQCSRCKSKEKAKKKLTILEAPNVLTIALKRFQLGKFGKLNKSIQFPEILNLAPYMSGTSDKSPIYRLYGVIVHLDVMNAAFSGHYVCYVKDIQNKWFKVDDSMVTSVDLDRVLTKGAYMLLYSRCSPRAPRLIRNSIADLKNKSNPSRTTTKFTGLKSRSMSPQLDVAHYNRYATTPESLASVESFYLKFHRLQKILEEDSSSDSFSFTSSNSDEGSCSTDSTRDSACVDDLSDYVFGSSSSSWRNSSDSDTSSSSSSPLYSRYYSPASNLDGNVSNPPNARWSKIDRLGSMTGDGEGRDRQQMKGSSSLVNSEGKGGDPILHAADTIRPSRKLIGSSSSRETDTVKLGYVNPLNDVKSGVSFKRSISERTD